ncbi:hypothetical protein Krac_5279 [Ktedonobacter racemifer DSM 44963]|uniref:Uncharacterized protein n=1 Tax=Ktedonobacter racemifer DSM 44963 TaxID=485913 RepID=D6TVM1_KTERA|nr:hypothetical protein Krac_5279 [Ktedonobacter racemifer DSM 44963]
MIKPLLLCTLYHKLIPSSRDKTKLFTIIIIDVLSLALMHFEIH